MKIKFLPLIIVLVSGLAGITSNAHAGQLIPCDIVYRESVKSLKEAARAYDIKLINSPILQRESKKHALNFSSNALNFKSSTKIVYQTHYLTNYNEAGDVDDRYYISNIQTEIRNLVAVSLQPKTTLYYGMSFLENKTFCNGAFSYSQKLN
jgi:hypothetical protein